MRWLEQDSLTANRSDLYLAQIALQVSSIPALVWGKKPELKLEDFILQPKGKAPTKKLSVEEETLLAKARWMPALLGKGRMPPKPENQ